MGNGIRAPYLPYDSLRVKADEFLSEHHPDGTIPVPIEEIVEYRLGLDIVPMPGLQANFQIESYLSCDQSEIRIDEKVYLNVPNRYRFSLAHEVAHLTVHQDVLSSLSYATVDEWKSVTQSIPADQYGWIELQAYDLAGLILVPSCQLEPIFCEAKDRAATAGVSLADPSDEIRKMVSSHIGTQFEVSGAVINKRLCRDRLWPSD